MKVSYDPDVKARAKAEGKGLMCIEIDGRPIGKGRITTQGPIDAEAYEMLAIMLTNYRDWQHTRHIVRTAAQNGVVQP